MQEIQNNALRDSGAAGKPKEQVPEGSSSYCPVCSQRLQSHRCKLLCPVCGYYMSCSDYY